MSTYKITGGIPLTGTVTPEANKNAILPIICACVLATEPVTLSNVPKSSSVRVMLQVFQQLGGKVSYLSDNRIKLNADGINTSKVDDNLAKRERATLMFLGPLLAKFNKAEIAESGGCKLGNRPLDTFFQGLNEVGVTIDKNDGYKMQTTGLKGNENIWLLEASVTGTENLILAAVLAKGKTKIYNAACEPHVQDLCNFLNSIGAQISGIGSNMIEITGVEKLTGGEWSIISDHIDIGGLIVAAAITGGEVRIQNAIPAHMTQILKYYSKLNLKVKIEGDDIIIPANQKLVAKLNVKGNIDKIQDQPWPGFPADLIPQALVLALASEGNMRIYSNMYETQLSSYEEFQKLHGNLIVGNPHQIITFGPAKFKANDVTAPNVLQAVHALVLAALAAQGSTIIRQADMLVRRYPDIVENLKKLGAKIEKI